MTTHTVPSSELPQVNESTLSVIKDLLGIVTFFACVAVPTLVIALNHWVG